MGGGGGGGGPRRGECKGKVRGGRRDDYGVITPRGCNMI